MTLEVDSNRLEIFRWEVTLSEVLAVGLASCALP